MGYNIGPTISVKGEEEYNASLKQIRQNMKYIKAEANNLTAAYDKNDKSIEAVTARVEGLKKAQEEQKKAVEAAKKALAEMTARGVDPASKAYRDMQANLDVAEAQLKTTTREIETHERALANAKDGVADYGDAVDDANSKLSGFGEDGNELVNVLDGTETQVWCGKKSVTRTEFYQSQAIGITPTCVVELWARDYANQQSYSSPPPVFATLRPLGGLSRDNRSGRVSRQPSVVDHGVYRGPAPSEHFRGLRLGDCLAPRACPLVTEGFGASGFDCVSD